MNHKIIAVDFDGTLCENRYPKIGKMNKELIKYLREEQRRGSKIILWTCRVGDELSMAINTCFCHKLMFDAINENIPEIVEQFGSDTRKVFATEYIDDRNTWHPEKKYDTQSSTAFNNDPFKFIDILQEAAETTTDDNSLLLKEAACIIARLLRESEEK